MEVAILILSMVLILAALTWLGRDKSGHKWVYRNPATRTCTVCDRQEDNYCRSWAYERYGLHAPGWWEEMRPGAGEKCTNQQRSN